MTAAAPKQKKQTSGNRRLGLEISDRFVRFLNADGSAADLHVGEWGQKNIPFGAVQSGAIKNRPQFEPIVRQVARESFFNEPSVVISAQQIKCQALHKDELPPMTSNNFRVALFGKASSALGQTSHEIAVSHVAVRDYVFLCTAAARPLLAMNEVLKGAGAQKILFFPQAAALSAAFVPNKGIVSPPHLIVEFGKERTLIAALEAGMPVAQSLLPVGGNDITATIRRLHQVSFDEAEIIKEEAGIIKELRQNNSSELTLLLMPIIETLNDLASRLPTIKEIKVPTVIVGGGAALLPGFIEFLKNKTDLHCVRVDIWKGAVDVSSNLPSIDFADSFSYATALGSTLAEQEKAFVFFD